MTDHLSTDKLSAYVNRELDAIDLIAADEHLSACPQCRAAASGLAPSRDFRVALGGTAGREHLAYEQFESYVGGAIGDVEREIVDVHIGACRECSQQLDEFRQLAFELETNSTRDLTATPNEASNIGFWNRLTTVTAFRFAVPAFATLVLAAAVWVGWFVTRQPADEIVGVVDVEPPTSYSGNAIDQPSPVPPSDDVNTNSAPRPVMSITDGRLQIEIDRDGNLKGLDAPQFEARVKSALTKQEIEIGQGGRELRSGAGVLMGQSSGVPFALRSPVGKIIADNRPQFSWRPLKDAESYVVTVYDANFNKIAASPPLKQTSWTIGNRLRHGTVYQWQVTALKNGEEIKSPVRPAPDAKFRVIDATSSRAIASARRAGTSRLVLGILYAEAGMVDEAEREFQSLLSRNPNSDAVRKLLRKVQAAR